MTKPLLLIPVWLFLLFSCAVAQVPQKVNYQAVARDAAGAPVTNKNISVRISINTGINPGFTEYQETQTAITNQFGLFTIKIGGNVTQGALIPLVGPQVINTC